MIEQREGELTFARIAELQRKPVEGKFNAAHLKEIHRRIFQDLPHHAPGEYRPDAPIHIKARALESSGQRYHVHYAPRREVDAGVEKVLSEFGGPDSLRSLNTEQFSGRMAKLYGDLDHLHPFKEGNSRTLRAFTMQLAREADYELNWNVANVDATTRDRLYIARDKAVMQRAFPGLDQDHAMKTENRAEYEAYMCFVAPFSKADTLEKLIKESTFHVKDLEVAKVFRQEPPEKAVQKHPELAGAAAVLTAIDKKAEADGMNEQQRAIIMARARQNVANSIERGELPEIKIREERQTKIEPPQRDPER